MAQIHCNFFSYSLGYPVDIELILPSFTSCNMGDPHSHALPDKFPVLYLLHGYGNDYQAWLRYTSIQRYAEEHRIAVVTFSCHNKAYQNASYGENFYDFLNKELPEFVENYFPISSNASQRYIAGLSMGTAARPTKSGALQRHRSLLPRNSRSRRVLGSPPGHARGSVPPDRGCAEK